MMNPYLKKIAHQLLCYCVIVVFHASIFFLNSTYTMAESNYNEEEAWKNDISADAWIVIDAETGDILIENNKDEQHYPASITKIVTTMMAIEQRELDEVVTISQTADETEGSSLDLHKGDEIILKDLLYGIMLHSGNDGAVAVAEHIAGNEQQFGEQMTDYVKSIGATNTHFINASGLPDKQHFTTAQDMAIITKYAMGNSVFRKIVGTQVYPWKEELWTNYLEEREKWDAIKMKLEWTGKPQIFNHNQLLGTYEGATGVKNGFTQEARYTLVGSAKRGETELIGVVLKSDNVDTAFQDMTILLDKGFAISTLKPKKTAISSIPVIQKKEEMTSKQQNVDIPNVPLTILNENTEFHSSTPSTIQKTNLFSQIMLTFIFLVIIVLLFIVAFVMDVYKDWNHLRL